MNAALGLDTSCYVTSVALVSDAGEVLYDGRLPLQVEQGGLGLRQSEAFFYICANCRCLWKTLLQRCTMADTP